ncbi:PP2C family protein-serine/threonine phosphatase [Heyndrickxia ginsengihumi]|uniref:PP2C family protein-serine/threonine phosphatase n=1 Tax=Heyndrickxia ginsengihumi TaxID=363870 RepID=UPI000472AE3F|nr:PP2C family protein-serine/threonine phosphatase [Heyndrickxia ginsengihumi]
MFHDSFTYHYGDQQLMNKSLQREMKLAKNIQSSLLNGKTPVFEGGEVIGSSLPARLIGGDYYDFYPLNNGKIRIVIGDVMGKGIPAAMLMILTRGAFRSAAESNPSPGATLTAINQAIYADLRTLRSFVTLFCADWDPKTRILTYANAGHNLPIHVCGNSEAVKQVPIVKGIMIGGLPRQVYEEESIQLESLDMVFFYTDGIIEAQNKDGEQYKMDRLIQTLSIHREKDIEEIEKYVLESIHQFTEGVPQKDDITMVLLKTFDQKINISSVNSPLL